MTTAETVGIQPGCGATVGQLSGKETGNYSQNTLHRHKLKVKGCRWTAFDAVDQCKESLRTMVSRH